MTVTPDHHFEVSRRIREEFENGRDYYALHGKPIHAPAETDRAPSAVILGWHNNHIFRG